MRSLRCPLETTELVRLGAERIRQVVSRVFTVFYVGLSATLSRRVNSHSTRARAPTFMRPLALESMGVGAKTHACSMMHARTSRLTVIGYTFESGDAQPAHSSFARCLSQCLRSRHCAQDYPTASAAGFTFTSPASRCTAWPAKPKARVRGMMGRLPGGRRPRRGAGRSCRCSRGAALEAAAAGSAYPKCAAIINLTVGEVHVAERLNRVVVAVTWNSKRFRKAPQICDK